LTIKEREGHRKANNKEQHTRHKNWSRNRNINKV